MKKVKLAIAVAVIVCAAATTYATNSVNDGGIPCKSSTELSQPDMTTDECDQTAVLCCFDSENEPILAGVRD